MTNHDLDWLAAQQPQRIAIDRAARERALLALAQHTAPRTSARGFRARSASSRAATMS